MNKKLLACVELVCDKNASKVWFIYSQLAWNTPKSTLQGFLFKFLGFSYKINIVKLNFVVMYQMEKMALIGFLLIILKPNFATYDWFWTDGSHIHFATAFHDIGLANSRKCSLHLLKRHIGTHPVKHLFKTQ